MDQTTRALALEEAEVGIRLALSVVEDLHPELSARRAEMVEVNDWSELLAVVSRLRGIGGDAGVDYRPQKELDLVAKDRLAQLRNTARATA